MLRRRPCKGSIEANGLSGGKGYDACMNVLRVERAGFPSRILVAILTVLGSACVTPRSEPELILHTVYFDLADPSQAEEFSEACRRELSTIPGVQNLAVGPREASQERAINQVEFDVAMMMVFASVSDLEAYLEHPRHLELVARLTPGLIGAQVFDARVRR